MVRLPAAGLDRVRVAVTLALSTSLATMSMRLSAVSSMYVSAAERLVAVGGWFAATSSLMMVAVALAILSPPPR